MAAGQVIASPMVTFSRDREQKNGNIFTGKNSYSGADMQAIVTIPGSRSSIPDSEVNNLRDTTSVEEEKLDRLNKSFSSLFNLQEQALAAGNTAEFKRLGRRLLTTAALRDRQEDQVRILSERLNQITRERIKEKQVKVLGELTTVSYSIHREKFPVRSLGSVYPKTFTRGPRTIAGSLLFVVFNQAVLHELLNPDKSEIEYYNRSTTLPDQIPPFDIIINFANELGSISQLIIYGVEIQDEGQVMSIDNMALENTMRFVARDIDPMRLTGARQLSTTSGGDIKIGAYKSTDLLNSDFYKRIDSRYNPFA